ncbi:MAG TPA: EAL domain-containing protein, partial [bacterium]|nr:EAL domain-containing protein [bacterium]
IRLEMTESELMEQAQSAVEKLEALKKLNIQLYIDDFGTGYSSLSYLHQFPIDALKIDRSFIQSLKPGDEESGIVKTIVLLARDLGLSVIVEGIETAEQLEIIRKLKCQYAQGFFFSKPLPPAEIETLLERNPQW